MGRNYFNSGKKSLYAVIFSKRRGSSIIRDGGTTIGIGEPSLYHALIIIFLEFFSWGLLTVPIINVISDTFPSNKFLMNGLILGVKGILSFLSAPMIGALSDIWGRKFFLLLTVFCTCMPIPWLRISPWWYFALFSISGVFSVTFSVVLAYVADITEKEDRSAAIGLVSATFGASLVMSPALGAWLSEAWSDDAVVALATAVAAADVFFIMAAVPESLPQKLRHSWSAMDWEKTDPFQSLRLVGEDKTVLLLCSVVFLSYLPEAGQFSCFFVYLKLVIGFSPEAVAAFIGLVGILSVLAQTGLLMALHRSCGAKTTITVGLVLQAIQLTWYGLGTKIWMMWAAGLLAAMSQITYPSVSAYVSVHTDRDKQGTVQGIITGVRGLCSGLGPALFGLVFYLFHVDLNIAEGDPDEIGALGAPIKNVVLNNKNRKENKNSYKNYIGNKSINNVTTTMLIPPVAPLPDGQTIADSYADISQRLIPGPPFLAGAFLVLLALMVISYLPDNPTSKLFRGSIRRSRSTSGGSSPLLETTNGNDDHSSGVVINNSDNSSSNKGLMMMKPSKSAGGRLEFAAAAGGSAGEGGIVNNNNNSNINKILMNNNNNNNINEHLISLLSSGGAAAAATAAIKPNINIMNTQFPTSILTTKTVNNLEATTRRSGVENVIVRKNSSLFTSNNDVIYSNQHPSSNLSSSAAASIPPNSAIVGGHSRGVGGIVIGGSSRSRGLIGQ